MSNQRLFFGLVIMGVSVLGCHRGKVGENSDVLATFDHQKITLKEMDQFLLTLPENNRWAPPGSDHRVWVEDKLRRLALKKLFTNSVEMVQLLADPATDARRQWLQIQSLTTALSEAVLKEIQPTEEEIKAHLASMQKPKSREPVLDFQHIYFRTDRGDPTEVKARAEHVAARAKAGEDFPSLVRQFSQSANAKEGGLVRNVNPSNLDNDTQSILASLEEGQVSALVESRTGLHLFRLIRRVNPEPPNPARQRSAAEGQLKQMRFTAHMAALREDLRNRIPIDTSQEPWQIGEFRLDANIREAFGLANSSLNEATPNHLIDTVLLAHEAKSRGLSSEKLEEGVAHALRLELLQRLFNRGYEDLERLLPPDRVRPFYDAQPALFAMPEKRRIGLIFVPQGRDSFSTQQDLETKVEKLRGGASFEDMAAEISTGPKASDGGDLGLLTPVAYSQLGPNIAAVIPTLDVGEVSDPIYCTDRVLSKNPNLLKGGFAVVKILELVPEQARSFEEAIDDVRKAYIGQYRQDLDGEIRDQFLADAGFKVLRIPDPAELVQ